jgi:hypothetical protein
VLSSKHYPCHFHDSLGARRRRGSASFLHFAPISPPHPFLASTMYAKRSALTPLTINTHTNSDGKNAVFAAAAFTYQEQAGGGAAGAGTSGGGSRPRRTSSSNRPGSRQTSHGPAARKPSMTKSHTYPGTSISPPNMYVRALYDYNADDRTSLSFKQGDIIQVITQLESGWWDGIINDVRGWFPSNYCDVVSEWRRSSRRFWKRGRIPGARLEATVFGESDQKWQVSIPQ